MQKKLARTPENEKSVRLELRNRHGPAYLAALARPLVQRSLESGISVLIDAVASMDEAEFYRRHFAQEFELVGIRTPFEARAARLSARGVRAMNELEIRERDELERVNLRTDLVLASASIVIDNDASLDVFDKGLREKIGF